MDRYNDADKKRQNPRAFYESLTKAELRRFVNNPLFLEEVLECAAESAALTQAVDEILEDEYLELAPEEQMQIDRAVQSLTSEAAARTQPVASAPSSENLAPVIYLKNRAGQHEPLKVIAQMHTRGEYRIEGMNLGDFVDARDAGINAPHLVLHRGSQDMEIPLGEFQEAGQEAEPDEADPPALAMAADGRPEEDLLDEEESPLDGSREELTLTEMYRAKAAGVTVVILSDRDEGLYLRLQDGT